jgi:predicted Rossmann-fold nucleotide-binding protein
MSDHIGASWGIVDDDGDTVGVNEAGEKFPIINLGGKRHWVGKAIFNDNAPALMIFGGGPGPMAEILPGHVKHARQKVAKVAIVFDDLDSLRVVQDALVEIAERIARGGAATR